MIKAKDLYEAFWERQREYNGPTFTYPPFDEQAKAIQSMWENIASDANTLIKR